MARKYRVVPRRSGQCLPRLRTCVQSGDVRGALRVLQVVVPSYRQNLVHAGEAGKEKKAARAGDGAAA
jgi:hypothetical protein